MVRRAWVYLFGEQGFGFVDLVVLLFVNLVVLAAVGFLVGMVWFAVAALLGFS